LRNFTAPSYLLAQPVSTNDAISIGFGIACICCSRPPFP